ncbi:hypothetical protein SLA2020_091560 [Shorea laevis]
MVVSGNDVLYGDWSERRTCVVLGGRGFLGRSLVNRLLRLGEWIVRVADSQSLQLDPSSDSDSLLSSALSSGQASFCQVDVRDVSQICKGNEMIAYLHDDLTYACVLICICSYGIMDVFCV